MRSAVPIALFLLAACPGDDGVPPDAAEQSLIPADTSAYQEVRDCRTSGDHLLLKIRILTDSLAHDPYINRNAPFPPGSIILKEERDAADTTCTGPIENWTIMLKLEDGSSPETLDFKWQRVRASDNKVITEDVERCVNCHSNCVAPDFFAYTCADP